MNASHKRKRPSGLTKEPLTQEQRQEKLLSKYYHAKVEATRSLRKAITFETQKMTKRIKKARDEQDAQAELPRLEEELGETKNINVEELALYYLQYSIGRSHKELAVVLQSDQAGDAPHKQASDSMKNVVGRLLGSKTFRNAIEVITQSLEHIAGIKSRSKTTKQKKTTEAFKSQNSVQKGKETVNMADEHSLASIDSGDEEARSLPRIESARAAAPGRYDTTSTFLPSLQSGYLPALDSSDDEGQLKGLFPAQKKERKNRRGQRARRKILEAKHGNKANHIIKEREQAQKDYEERVARRAARETEKTGANAIAIEEAERNRKERREAKLRPIHDSWAVAKAAKEKMKQAKPEGQKITFD